jgi:hypothetical protein
MKYLVVDAQPEGPAHSMAVVAGTAPTIQFCRACQFGRHLVVRSIPMEIGVTVRAQGTQ